MPVQLESGLVQPNTPRWRLCDRKNDFEKFRQPLDARTSPVDTRLPHQQPSCSSPGLMEVLEHVASGAAVGIHAKGGLMDWSGWAIFGPVATVFLTAVLVGAQLGGLTRLDIPLMLGTVFIGDPDRGRFVGFFVHLIAGQFFALFYGLAFVELGRSGWWLGALFGVAHSAVAGAVLVPILATVHPRMATERAGPTTTTTLEPPGLMALNYGWSTPLVAMVAHAGYGAILGMLMKAG